MSGRILSRDAAMVYAALRTHPTSRPRSRDLRHALPRPLTRRAYAHAWRELAARGLINSQVVGGGH